MPVSPSLKHYGCFLGGVGCCMDLPVFLGPACMETICLHKETAVGAAGENRGQNGLTVNSVLHLKLTLCYHSVKCTLKFLVFLYFDISMSLQYICACPSGRVGNLHGLLYSTYFYSVEYLKCFREPVRTVPYV